MIDCSGSAYFPASLTPIRIRLGEGAGRTADGFYEGSAAAALGGVTTFIDFADQIPGKTLLQGANIRIGEAADAVVDFALHQGVYRFHEGIGEELDELARAGITALKIFTTYRNFGVFLDPGAWESLFSLCAEKHFLVAIHAEDDEIIEKIAEALPPMSQSAPGPSMHPFLRPARAEASAIMKTGLVALRHHLPLYFVHVSSALGMEAVRDLRRRGLKVIAETTPHYLLLTEERLAGEDGPLFLMTPPLRGPADRSALLNALASGEIDVVATDHCAYTPEQKNVSADCREIPAGVPGTGEAASLLFTLLPGDIENRQSLAALFSRNPRGFRLLQKKDSRNGNRCRHRDHRPHASGIYRRPRSNARGLRLLRSRVQGAPVMTILRVGARGSEHSREGSVRSRLGLRDLGFSSGHQGDERPVRKKPMLAIRACAR